MSQMLNISGPGVGLPPPSGLYPQSLLNGAPFNVNTNVFTLAAGEALPIPAGTWIVTHGPYSIIQWLDPITGIWRSLSSAREAIQIISSDGFTRRVANLTGCPVGAVVTNGGSNYVQGTTSVTVNTGTSTWYPIVGGQINTTVSVVTTGSGYGIPPLVFFDAPPSPGVQATGYAAISSGTITSITVTNQGAGYPSAPNVQVLANPADPNLNTLTNGTATCTTTGAGKVTAVLCTNPGNALAAIPTLTVAGAGASAAVTPVWMNTITGATIAGVGAGYAATTLLTTVGGITAATPTFTNPGIELTGYIPRQAQIGLSVSGGTITSISTIYDGGLFTGAPSALVLTNGIVTTVGTVTLVTGGTTDTVMFQPV